MVLNNEQPEVRMAFQDYTSMSHVLGTSLAKLGAHASFVASICSFGFFEKQLRLFHGLH